MPEYYTIEECYAWCEDDDRMVHERTEEYRKYDQPKRCFKSMLIPGPFILSDRWQIKKAEPKVLSADNIAEKWLKERGLASGDYYFDCSREADKNGQLREWLRPEQVELRKAVRWVQENATTANWKIFNRLFDALENLKPPYEEKDD